MVHPGRSGKWYWRPRRFGIGMRGRRAGVGRELLRETAEEWERGIRSRRRTHGDMMGLIDRVRVHRGRLLRVPTGGRGGRVVRCGVERRRERREGHIGGRGAAGRADLTACRSLCASTAETAGTSTLSRTRGEMRRGYAKIRVIAR